MPRGSGRCPYSIDRVLIAYCFVKRRARGYGMLEPSRNIGAGRHDVRRRSHGMPVDSGRSSRPTGYGTCERARRVNRNPLLFRLGLIAWIVWVGVTADRLVDAQQPPAGTAPAATTPAQAPPAQTPPAQATPTNLPPGYAGTDACVLCHEPEGKSITHSRHGQAKDPRSPAGHARMRKLPRSRAGTCGRRREGAHQEVQSPDAQRGQRDLSDLPQPRHARGLGREHARGAEPDLHHVPQRARAAIDAGPAGEADRDAGVRHLSPAAGGQDRTRGRAHAGARGQDVLQLVPQPARLDHATSRT